MSKLSSAFVATCGRCWRDVPRCEARMWDRSAVVCTRCASPASRSGGLELACSCPLGRCCARPYEAKREVVMCEECRGKMKAGDAVEEYGALVCTGCAKDPNRLSRQPIPYYQVEAVLPNALENAAWFGTKVETGEGKRPHVRIENYAKKAGAGILRALKGPSKGEDE